VKNSALVRIFALYEDRAFSPEGPLFFSFLHRNSIIFLKEIDKNSKANTLFGLPDVRPVVLEAKGVAVMFEMEGRPGCQHNLND
jgi:hypothetical protein